MGLAYILRQVTRDSGLASSSTNQRSLLVDTINSAAKQLFESQDLPGSFQEIIVPVTANTQVALPSFVGRIRGMREYYSKIPWVINDLVPKYSSNKTYTNDWYKWRDKGYSPLMRSLASTGALTLTTRVIGSTPPEITVTGSTIYSNNVAESFTPNSTDWILGSGGFYGLDTTNAFSSIRSFKKDGRSDSNIFLYDVEENLVATLDNDSVECLYHIFDVSQYPFGGDCPTDTTLRTMEVLYKPTLHPMTNDEDDFILPGYDDVIVTIVRAIFAEKDQTEEARNLAIHHYKKAAEMLQNITGDETKGKQMEVEVCPHPHDKLFSIYRGWPSFYASN